MARWSTSVPVGEGVDATSFDPQTKFAFTSNGGAGHGHGRARRLGVGAQGRANDQGLSAGADDDASTRQRTRGIYVAATDYEPQAPGSKDRPKAVAGTFRVLTYQMKVSGAMNGFITRLLVAGLLVAAPPAGFAQDAPLTLKAALDQARINSQQFRSAQLASDLAAEETQAGEGGAAAVGQRIRTGHRDAGQRHAVGRLRAERRSPRVRPVAERARRRVLALEMGRVPRRGSGRGDGPRESRRRRTRPRRDGGAGLLRARAAQRKVESARQSLREVQQFLDITRSRRPGARWRTPTW